MKLKSSKTCFIVVLLVFIQSTSLSSAGKTILNEITNSVEHQRLSQAVREIIRSLDVGSNGDTPSATDVIKVTSHDVHCKDIDPFTETVLRNINGLFEFHIRDYDITRNIKRTRHNALLIVSKAMPEREIEEFLLSYNFESQKKLLIILLDKTFSPLQPHIKLMVQALLEIMWRKFTLNVHVVTAASNGDVIFHTYFPFTKDFCGQVHPVVWNIYRNGTFVMQREHFPRKNENLFRCALNVAVFNAAPYMIVLDDSRAIDVDGVDGKLLKTLANELNFTIKYNVVSDDWRWGEIYANQSATGALKLILNKSVDLSLGMFSKTTSRAKVLSTSMTYAQSPLIMIVPPGPERSSFEKLLNPFDDSVWWVVNGMMLIVIVVTSILKCQSRRVQDFVFGEKNRTPFMNVVNVIVGLPMHKTPRRNFSRWILTMFVILWLILRSLYQAVLYKNLQSTDRNLPVQTIEETLRLGFMYYMISPTQENVKYLPEVYDRKVVVSRNETLEIVKRLNDPSIKAAFLSALDTARYANKVKLYGFNLNVCKEPLMLRQYGIVFPKGSFLVSSFDEELIILMETGLIGYWLSEHTEPIKSPLPHAQEPIKLTLNHLLSAYQVLLFGVGLASIALTTELVSMKMKCLRNFFEFLE